MIRCRLTVDVSRATPTNNTQPCGDRAASGHQATYRGRQVRQGAPGKPSSANLVPYSLLLPTLRASPTRVSHCTSTRQAPSRIEFLFSDARLLPCSSRFVDSLPFHHLTRQPTCASLTMDDSPVKTEGGAARHRAGYKSWKKKYRKMRIVFDQKMHDGEELHKQEAKAAALVKRLAVENEYVPWAQSMHPCARQS